MRAFRSTLLFTPILVLVAGLALAAGSTSIWVGPGSSLVTYAGYELVVETTDDVIVYLSIVDGEVVGTVEVAPSTASADVKITLRDDPERVIFEGKVVAPTWFADYLPHETGRGEQ